MSFWQSPINKPITGLAEDSHVGSFDLIPDGTTALAMIKLFELKPEFNDYPAFFQITWKIIDGEFKNREVRQKIKAFDNDPEKVHTALNMMKRVYDLCEYKPSHANLPTNQDLANMHGKSLGIKIQEWDFNGKQGNFISEVHGIDGFVQEKGIKKTVTHPIESAFSRNKNTASVMDDDIPF